MLSDIVVDANVLIHTQDPNVPYFAAACDFVRRLVARATVICVDPGFSTEESTDRSVIGLEYRTHLRFGSPGYNAVATLAAQKRIKQVTDKVGAAVHKRVNQLLRNKKDRTYVRVAVNSDEQTFVSHDYTDFQFTKREAIMADLGVRVLEASQSCPLL